jgi:(p)ppGpp synthase/HD superfamily hydrolase
VDHLTKIRTWATLRHGDQRYGSLPYCYHLAAVEATVVEICPWVGRQLETLRASAWGHDLVEDQGVAESELLDAGFSKDACGLILLVTDGPDGKPGTYRRIASADKKVRRMATLLKLADRIANVRQCKLPMELGGNVEYLADYRQEQEVLESALLDREDEELLPVWQQLREELGNQG